MAGDDECTICAGTTEGPTTRLECGHAFHVHCALEWFRYHNTTCPNCRSEERQARYTQKTPAQRVSIIRRKRNLAPHVRRMIRQLDAARQSQRQTRTALVELRKAHADVFKEERCARMRLHHCRRRECTLVRRIDLEDTSVPLLTFGGSWTDDEVSGDDE